MRNTRLVSKWATLCSIALLSLQANFSVHANTVADWTFEEGVPGQPVTNVLDYSGNGHTGSIVWGSPTFVQSGPGGQGNVSMSFPPGPPGGGFSPQDSLAFNIQTFTLEASFKPDPLSPAWAPWGGYLIGGFVPNGIAVYGLGYRGDTHRASFGPLSGPIPSDGQSHHVAVVYVNRTATLYIDGQSMGTTNLDLSPYYPPAGTPMRVSVGSNYNAYYWFTGVIDRVRISDQALAPQSFFYSPATNHSTVADWTFEEGVPGQAVTNVLDYSGNGHTGSIVWGSPTFVQSGPGSQGNVSINLPPGGGSGSGFRPQDSPAFNFPNQFTLEVEFRPGTNDAGWRYLIGDFIPNGPVVLGLGYRSDPSEIGMATLVGTAAVPIPQDGQSHHVAAVYVNQTLTLYLDGQPRSSTNIDIGPTFAPSGSSMRLCVGSDYNGGYWLDGIVDRVRISNQALAPQDFFNAGRTTTVADWTFEEGVPGQPVTNVLDYSGNGHTGSTIFGSPTFVQTGPGTQGNVSISLPPGSSSGSGFRAPDSPAFNLPDQFTLELSIRPGTNNATWWRYLVGDFNENGQGVLGFAYRSDPSSIGMGPLVGPQAVPFPLDGQSHHVAAVYGNQTLTLYLDGQARSSTNINLGPTFPLSGSPMRLCVGSDYNGGFWFNGVIDRVRISDRALAPQDFFTASSTTNGGCNPPAGIVGWWRGDGNANDSVGGNNGNLLPGTAFAAGEVGQAFQLDGIQGGVVIPDATELNFGSDADFSIEAWIKANPVTQQRWFTIVDKRNAPAYVNGVQYGGAVGYALFLDYGRLSVGLAPSPLEVFNELNFVSSQPDLRDGKFHHVALTVHRGSTTGGNLYVDGQVVLTFDPTGARGDLSNTEPFRIGNPATPGLTSFFPGTIDEVSLYRRALTSVEIQSVFLLGSAGKCLAGGIVGDGIPDAWRLKYFGTNFVNNPQAAANADPDHDGADNYQEYLAGTDPLSSNSIPALPAIVSTYAGASGGFRDGYRTAAQFDGSITDLKYDPQGRIWLLESSVSGDLQRPDTGGQRVRIIDTNGVVTTLTGGTNGLTDGSLNQALFSIPNGLAFDSAGNAFIADQGNDRIRKIGTSGIVSTFAGSTAGYLDGVGTNAQFNAPSGVAIDANDNVYVADGRNQKIRIITPEGLVSTFAGNFGTPVDIAIAKDGTIYVADSADNAIRKINTNGVTSVFATSVSGVVRVSLDAAGNVYASTLGGVLYKYSADGTQAWSVGSSLGYRDGLAATAQFIQLGRVLSLPDGSLIVGDYYHIRQITIGIPPLLLMNPTGGPFTNSVDVALTTAVEGGIIRYTVDGTAPGTNSPAYAGGVTLTNATAVAITLQAVVFVNNHPVSEVVSATFTNAFNAWRAQIFGTNFATNPQAAATADPDGDGSNNFQEFLDGTNPQDPKSVKIRVAARIVPLVTWNSVSNQVYRVLRRDDPNSTNSIVVAPSILATNTTTSYIDVNPNLKAFYWIEILTNGP